MLYLVAVLASLVMLVAGSSVIWLTIAPAVAKIVDALIGRVPARSATWAEVNRSYAPRKTVRPTPRLRVPPPLRAAA
jgi:uncharacterized membrane protein